MESNPHFPHHIESSVIQRRIQKQKQKKIGPSPGLNRGPRAIVLWVNPKRESEIRVSKETKCAPPGPCSFEKHVCDYVLGLGLIHESQHALNGESVYIIRLEFLAHEKYQSPNCAQWVT